MTNSEAARDALIERFLAMDALARVKSRNAYAAIVLVWLGISNVKYAPRCFTG